MKKLVLIASVVFIITTCYRSRKWGNPVDPNRDNAGKSTDKVETSGTTKDDINNPETVTSTGNETNQNQPGVAFNFSNVFSVTPKGCTKVSQVKVFDNGSEIMAFVLTDCGSNPQVYLVRTSYSGEGIESPKNLTADCGGINKVTEFAVDKGDSGYLLAYLCGTENSSSVSTKTELIGVDGKPGSSSLFESGQNNHLFLSWNSNSKIYGLSRSNKFQRFNEAGIAVGGPVVIANNLTHMNQSQVGWIFIWSESGYDGYHCSSLSEKGTIKIDDIAISELGTVNNILFGNEKLFVVGAWGESALVVSIDSASCTLGDRPSFKTIGNNIAAAYNPNITINSDVQATLIKTKENSLIVATYPKAGQFDFYGTSSVTGFTNLDSADMAVIQDKLYVAYAKDGLGYVSYSDETVE